MYYILIAIHVVSCLFLIASILLQAGKGGGLMDTGQTQSVLGTQAPQVLKKATTISAIVFITMSLVLAMSSSRRSKSLFQQMNIPKNMPITGANISGIPSGDNVVPAAGSENIPVMPDTSK